MTLAWLPSRLLVLSSIAKVAHAGVGDATGVLRRPTLVVMDPTPIISLETPPVLV